MLPDVPTVAESGLPGFENSGWFGLHRARRHATGEVLAKVQQDDAVKVLAYDRHAQGAPVRAGHDAGRQQRRAEFAKAMDAESVYWATVVKRPQARRELNARPG